MPSHKTRILHPCCCCQNSCWKESFGYSSITVGSPPTIKVQILSCTSPSNVIPSCSTTASSFANRQSFCNCAARNLEWSCCNRMDSYLKWGSDNWHGCQEQFWQRLHQLQDVFLSDELWLVPHHGKSCIVGIACSLMAATKLHSWHGR